MNGMLLPERKASWLWWSVFNAAVWWSPSCSQTYVLLYRPQSESSESADRCHMFTAHGVAALRPRQSLQQQRNHSPMRLLCRPSSAASCLIFRQVCAPEGRSLSQLCSLGLLCSRSTIDRTQEYARQHMKGPWAVHYSTFEQILGCSLYHCIHRCIACDTNPLGSFPSAATAQVVSNEQAE